MAPLLGRDGGGSAPGWHVTVVYEIDDGDATGSVIVTGYLTRKPPRAWSPAMTSTAATNMYS